MPRGRPLFDARGTRAVAALQNEWSLWQREAEKPLPAGAAASSKKGTLAACAAAGVTFVAHSPLGGLKARRGERPPGGGSAGLGPLAAARGMSAHAAALACLLHRGGQLGARVVAIPGARSAGHAADSVSAAALVLTDAEVAAVMGPL